MPQAMPLTSAISQSSTRKRTYKTLTAEFGNGYSQTAPDGINNVRDEWNLSYENLTDAERTTVVAALDAVQTWDYLTWQAPGDAASKRWKVTPEGWSERTTGTHWTISFVVKQVY